MIAGDDRAPIGILRARPRNDELLRRLLVAARLPYHPQECRHSRGSLRSRMTLDSARRDRNALSLLQRCRETPGRKIIVAIVEAAPRLFREHEVAVPNVLEAEIAAIRRHAERRRAGKSIDAEAAGRRRDLRLPISGMRIAVEVAVVNERPELELQRLRCAQNACNARA